MYVCVLMREIIPEKHFYIFHRTINYSCRSDISEFAINNDNSITIAYARVVNRVCGNGELLPQARH